MQEVVINWSDPNLCLHSPDYSSRLLEVSEIIERLESILSKWLLTPRQLGRRKNCFWVTSEDVIDVLSPLANWDRWDDPKESILTMVDGDLTSVMLLLSVPHKETWTYPYSTTKISPEIKGLIFSRKTRLTNKKFISWILSLSERFNIPVLDPDWNQIDLMQLLKDNRSWK